MATKNAPRTVKDVPAQEFVVALAQYFRSTGKVRREHFELDPLRSSDGPAGTLSRLRALADRSSITSAQCSMIEF